MSGDDWGILIGIIVAIGSVVGPWMWSVNSKLAKIASYGRAFKHLARIVAEHDRKLNDHGGRIENLETEAKVAFRKLSTD